MRTLARRLRFTDPFFRARSGGSTDLFRIQGGTLGGGGIRIQK